MLRAASTAARRTSTRAFTSTRAAQDFYPGIDKIQYEGKASNNPLAFKHYNADEIIMGKTMKEVRRAVRRTGTHAQTRRHARHIFNCTAAALSRYSSRPSCSDAPF
jgi:dienelactone hydrolase